MTASSNVQGVTMVAPGDERPDAQIAVSQDARKSVGECAILLVILVGLALHPFVVLKVVEFFRPIVGGGTSLTMGIVYGMLPAILIVVWTGNKADRE